jgi:lyso-ornithine lipid O-acyltransferase
VSAAIEPRAATATLPAPPTLAPPPAPPTPAAPRSALDRGRAALRSTARSGHLVWTSLAAIGDAGRGTLPQRARTQRLRDVMAEVVRSHQMSIDVEGRWPTEPCVLIANHVSYIDPVVIGAVHPIAPLAKAEVNRWPLIGTIGRRFGAIFVDRADPMSGARALRQAQATLAAGVSVLTFPEGTTSDGEGILPFHLGAFGLAVLANVPVVPVAITYDSPELAWTGGTTFLPHYLRTAARSAISVRLRVGEPMRARRPPGVWRPSATMARWRRTMAQELSSAALDALEELLLGRPGCDQPDARRALG